MLPSRTVLSTLCYRRRCCVYLGLLVFIRAAFCVNGSFGNLVTSVIPGSSTRASPSGTDIVKDADPINKCVTYTTSPSSSPYIDVGVGSNSDVRTIIVYTRKIDPTPVTVPMVLTDGSRYTFTHDFTPFHTDANTVYVFMGNKNTSYVRVKAADPSAGFTVCMMKVYDVSLSEYCTCDDPCSRNTDYICTATNVCNTSATTCHGRNVALNKTTKMSSTYKSDDGSFAVNGNTGTTFSGSGYTKDKTQWNCIHTAEERNHYWQVDLGRNYIVAYLTIYRRGSVPGKERMSNVEVKLDDQLCTTLTYPQIEKERIDVTCTPPLSGQVVKLSRDLWRYDFLNLCEVQVWECEPGYYGHRCTEECSANCLGGRKECDVQGECTKGCEPGYYGHRCTGECSANCLGGRKECDVQGECTKGCEDGFYGSLCHSNCPKKCQDTRCDRNTGKCTCADGWFGPTCDETCSAKCLKCEQTKTNCTQCGTGRYALPWCQSKCSTHCQNQECDTRTGHCSACTAGWYLPTCTKECSTGCQNQQCDQTTGHCSCKGGWKGDKCDGCIPGKYGSGCQQSCSEGCTDNQCNDKTGHCACRPGWDPHDPKCDTPCAPGTYGAGCGSPCGGGCKDTCSPQTGQCDCKPGWKPANNCVNECDNGRYGDHCSKTCGAGCSNVCNKANGHCECNIGWFGETCDRRCNPGKYGTGCQQSCGEGCVAACDDQTGHCACKPGWVSHQSMCDTSCPRGSYGPGCNLTCGSCRHGSACEHDTGSCQQGCAEGFKGDTCQEKESDTPGAASIAILLLGLIALIAVIVAVVFILLRRQRKGRVPPPHDTRRMQGENIYMNSPDLPVYFESYGGGRATTREDDLDPGESNPTYLLEDQAGAALDAAGDDDNEDDEFVDEDKDEVTEDNRYTDYLSLKLNLDRHQKYLLDRLTSGELVTEYKRLPTGLVHDHKVGSLVANKDKNRFKRIFPYDHSRVMLTPEGDDPFSDYINASFVRDQNDRNAYIASQGPMQTTVADFWRMVWKENVTQIVMLTNLMEKTKRKCHQYWPEKGHHEEHGALTVTGVDVQLRADFYTRTFHLKATSGSVRTVTQYHMVTWPDHGVPSAFSLVNLWRYIKARTDANAGPLLVHCSAGVGRTGTYIALDILMDMLLRQTHHRSINVFSVVKRLRDDRVVMIQTVEQYIFLHEALLEAYTSRDTRMTLDKMDAAFPTGIRLSKVDPRTEAEFKSLSQMKNFLSKPKYTLANMEENKDKNRDPKVLPDDNHLVYLSVHVPGRNQYINAVTMPSFRQQRGMLLTQLPMADTVVDFWRLVEGFDVNTIVSIASGGEEDRGSYYQYWPRDHKHHVKTGPFTVKLTEKQSLGEALTSYSLKCQKGSKSRVVRVLHYRAWGEEVPEETSDLLRVLEILDTTHNDAIDRPFIVQCWDGATKSGLFCSLYDVISRSTYDREVDVYLTARLAQSIRPEAVTSQAQYRYCYHVVQEYKKAFDVYANS